MFIPTFGRGLRRRLHLDPDELAMVVDLASVLAGALILWQVGAFLSNGQVLR